jgi:hypothetical protein
VKMNIYNPVKTNHIRRKTRVKVKTHERSLYYNEAFEIDLKEKYIQVDRIRWWMCWRWRRW